MSEAKPTTKATKRSSGKKAPTAIARDKPSASARNGLPAGLHSTPWHISLLSYIAAALALTAAVFYGITRFSTEQFSLDSSSTCKLSAFMTNLLLWLMQLLPASFNADLIVIADDNTRIDQIDLDSINNIEGIFPKGCQWRDVQHEGHSKKFWSEEEYEYWHGDVQQWTPEMPKGCSVKGKPASR